MENKNKSQDNEWQVSLGYLLGVFYWKLAKEPEDLIEGIRELKRKKDES